MNNVECKQPFREGQIEYVSDHIRQCSIRYEPPLIMMSLPKQWHVMSNAVFQGGVRTASTVVHYKVPLDYNSASPVDDYYRLLQEQGLDPSSCIGFMTSAKLTHAAIAEYDHPLCKLLVMATAGTANAARAGYERPYYDKYEAGTINVTIFVDGRMSESAMVNAIMTATEAKAAALQELGTIEQYNGAIATGTTSDAIAILVSQEQAEAHEHEYAGTATLLGGKIAELVYRSVYVAAQTQSLQ